MKWKVWKDDKIEDHDKGVGDGINQTEIMTFPCVYVWGEKLRGGCYRFRFQNLGGHFNLAINRKVLQEIVRRPGTWINGLSSTLQQTEGRVKQQWMFNEAQKLMVRTSTAFVFKNRLNDIVA